jgi:hypothetical protein
MLLKFAVPEAKPRTNRTPGSATAQDAAETFDVLGGTDLLREQNHAPHEQQYFNGDEEISKGATKLLMIANTATPLSTEMIAAFESAPTRWPSSYEYSSSWDHSPSKKRAPTTPPRTTSQGAKSP